MTTPEEPREWHYTKATITRPLTVPWGVLRKGDKGDPVRRLQQALNFVGSGWGVHASGEFATCTENAVKAFQKVSKGDDLTTPLPVTGVYDHATARALNRRVLEGAPPVVPPPPPPAEKRRYKLTLQPVDGGESVTVEIEL